jgi:hypothetical protein
VFDLPWKELGVPLSLCILAVGCASAGRGHQGLPTAQSDCHIGGLTGAQLNVRIIDTRGDDLPGIPVVATLIDKATPMPLLERTTSSGSDGRAVMELPGNHTYQVLVRQSGFVPRSGAVFLAAGCRTEMFIQLAIKRPLRSSNR